MNEENQLKTSEKIASQIMRFLAVIGIISVLVIAVWIIVQGIKLLPTDENLSATVSSVKNIFSEEGSVEESLAFELAVKTIPVDEQTTLIWSYTGQNAPRTYTFAYSCGTETSLRIMSGTDWEDLSCNTPFVTDDTKITIIPNNILTRFSDIELRIEAGELRDTTVITVFNTNIATTTSSATPATSSVQTKVPTQVQPTSNVTTPSSSASTPSTAPITRTVPLYNGPADLVLEIQETGILTEKQGKDAVRPTSPIPSNKTAAVSFTVTNKGGVTSGAWFFKAELPIEGDHDFKYTSPVQAPLLSGMEVEYTLGFDEVLEAKNGTIRIEIFPTGSGDTTKNNKDSITIKIDER